MALIKADGFDLYANLQTNLSVRWPVIGNTVEQIQSTNGRFGGGCVRLETAGEHIGENFTEVNTAGAGGALYLDGTATHGGIPLFRFKRNSGASEQLTITLNSDRSIHIKRGGTTLASTGASIISQGSWNWIEVKATCRIGTDGSCEVRLNENTILSVTSANTASSGADGIDQLQFVSGSNNTDTDNRWDDVVIWDTTGTANNDWFGDTRIETLMPTADTAQADFTPLAGSNFANVDDPLQDGDTTYVQSTTVGHQDLYTTSDMGGSPVIPINAIQLVNYTRKTDAGPAAIRSVVSEGATTTVNTAQNLLTTYAYYEDIHETNPRTGVAWTQADINGMEIGIQAD